MGTPVVLTSMVHDVTIGFLSYVASLCWFIFEEFDGKVIMLLIFREKISKIKICLPNERCPMGLGIAL